VPGWWVEVLSVDVSHAKAASLCGGASQVQRSFGPAKGAGLRMTKERRLRGPRDDKGCESAQASGGWGSDGYRSVLSVCEIHVGDVFGDCAGLGFG
jgi:hypothetical protein